MIAWALAIVNMLFRGEDGASVSGECVIRVFVMELFMSMCVECYLGDTSVESQSDSTPVEGNSANLSAA